MNSPISVLLVGGSEDDAEELLHVLEKGPFVPAIHRVTSRNALRKSLAEGDWDAVVADFDHPPFGGVAPFQTFQEVGKDVPFILISATADATTAAELVAGGVHDCIERSRLDRLIPALVRELKAARTRENHRQVERALRESEARFRAVIDNSPAAIVVKDADGRLLLVNKQWERQHGLSAKAAEGKTLLDLFRRETATILSDHDKEVLATGRSAEFEYESVGVDGLPQTDMVVKFPILGPDGSVAAIGASHTNITERKRAEEALRWSEWDLRGILDNMVDTFFRTDRDGRIIMMSPSVADLTGFTPEEMLGRHFADFFADPETPTDLMMLLDENGGKLDGYEVMLRHRDGTELWALTTARRYFDEDGDIAGIEGVAHDITVRKRAEQALRDSEDRFRDFAEASSDWMWETGTDNHYTFVSDRFLDLLGVPREEIIGQSPFTTGDSIIHPADLMAHKEVLAGRHPFRDFQYSIKDNGGGLHVIRVSGKPRFGADGAFLGYRGTANDITAIVAAEERETLVRRQFLDAIETVPVSFALFDAEDRLVLWNQLYQSQILPEIKLKPGLRFEDLVRQTAANGRIDGDSEQRESWILERLDRHRDPAGPFVLQRTTDWLQIREHRTPDGSTLLVAVDISDLRRTEEALRDAQASLESVLSAPPWFCGHGAEAGSPFARHGAGRRAAPGRRVGRSITDVYGKYPESSTPPRARHGATSTRPLGRRRYSRSASSRCSAQRRISRLRRRRHRHHRAPPGRGKPPKLSLAVEQSPAAILITDLDGIIEYANPRFYETTGFTPVETLGKTRLPQIRRHRRRAVRPDVDHHHVGARMARELGNRRKNGELFWSSTASARSSTRPATSPISSAWPRTPPTSGDGGTAPPRPETGSVGLSPAASPTTSNHPDRHPRPLPDRHRKTGSEADVQFNLDQIKVASDRAKDLVQQLLAFSRRREANLRPVGLNAIVDEAVKLVHASIPSTIAIEWHVAENAVTVLADPTQIHQVLLNLCSNAADAIGDTAGAITIGVESIITTAPIGVAGHDLAPGQYVCLRVGDTGCGMDAYTLARAFDPFFTTKAVGAGTGLGLAAVHGIVQDHGGGIEVLSEPGKGTTFSIYLPCARAETAKDVKKIRTEFGGTERILLVDDERMVLQSIGTYLEHFGYKVEALTSPAAAQ